jgi:hypothetical protein
MMVIKLDCVGVTGDVGKISEEAIPAASAGCAIPRDSEENLLLDTIVRIRIATKLVTPMLTELPGEVRRLINDLEERVEKWKTWYDSAASDAKDWRRDAQKMFGIMHNDILSAMDDCIELGMDAEQMRSVVKKIIEKTKLPDKA